MAFILLAVAVAVLVGMVTANAAYAAIALSIFSLVLSVCKYQHKRSLAP